MNRCHRFLSRSVPALFFVWGTASAEPIIVVTGSGSAEVPPDRVTVEFTVQNRSRTAAEASEENVRKTRPILEALHRLGVPDTAVTSAGFAVQPPWDPRRGGRKQNESQATHRVRVKVREIRSAGSIVEAVLDSGADQVESVSFTVSDIDSAREAAISEAVAQARGDAEVMARAAGGQLGPLIEVTTQGTAAPPRAYSSQSMVVAGASAQPSITPGPTRVTVTVLGRWGFVEGKALPSREKGRVR
jgi:hypothetical protein